MLWNADGYWLQSISKFHQNDNFHMVLTLNFPCYRACDDLKSWEVLSEDCLSFATSHGLCGLLGRVPQRPTF